MTGASAFTLAATSLAGISLSTGITLRVLHRSPYAPMLALLIASGMLQIPACTLRREWFGLFWGLGVTAVALGLLALDAAKAAP